ncbi:hypothetical protein [Syntrophomonas curvata]
MHEVDKIAKLLGIIKRLNQTRENLDKIPDELQRRRLKKKYYINQLIALKFTCRAVNALLDNTPAAIISRNTKFSIRNHFGSLVLASTLSMEDDRIKLSRDEIRAILNISLPGWKGVYGYYQPESIAQPLLSGLSQEPMVNMAQNAASNLISRENRHATRELLTLLGIW